MDLDDRATQFRMGPTEASGVIGDRNVSRLIEWLRSSRTDVPPAHIPALITQLASLQTELAARLLQAPEPETVYLTLKQLAQRTGIGKSTLRAMKSEGFDEGVHFIQNGRKLLFMWPAVDAQIRAIRTRGLRQASEIFEPFVRRGRRRGS